MVLPQEVRQLLLDRGSRETRDARDRSNIKQCNWLQTNEAPAAAAALGILCGDYTDFGIILVLLWTYLDSYWSYKDSKSLHGSIRTRSSYWMGWPAPEVLERLVAFA